MMFYVSLCLSVSLSKSIDINIYLYMASFKYFEEGENNIGPMTVSGQNTETNEPDVCDELKNGKEKIPEMKNI